MLAGSTPPLRLDTSAWRLDAFTQNVRARIIPEPSYSLGEHARVKVEIRRLIIECGGCG
jgi:hypothetical protein